MRLFTPLSALVASLASQAMAEVPRVAVDIAPVHGLVSRVMDGVGEPDMVVPLSASVHSFDLRPSAAAALEAAEVVFWIGPELTPWLEKSVRTLAADASVTVLLELEETQVLPLRDEHAFEQDDDQEHHDDHAEHDEHASHNDQDGQHDHDHSGSDPHAWLSPENAEHWLDEIAAILSDADPDNAAAYAANADAGKAEIRNAVVKASARLEDVGRVRYLVHHDAYQYFENRFGLSPVGAVTLGDAAAPGPERVSEIQEHLQAHAVDCFLVEPQQVTSLARVISADNNLPIRSIDPLGADLELGTGFYTALLADMTKSFADCK